MEHKEKHVISHDTQNSEPIPELAEPKSPQESEKSSNDEPIIISDEEKSDNNQIIWIFVIISFIIMGFAILKKKVQHRN